MAKALASGMENVSAIKATKRLIVLKKWKFLLMATQILFLSGDSYSLQLTAQYPMTIYISSGLTNEPTEFNYDLAFKQVTSFRLDSSSFPSMNTFVMAVKIEGIEYNGNIFYQHIVNAWFNKGKVATEEEYFVS
jgi:hypothetical protein